MKKESEFAKRLNQLLNDNKLTLRKAAEIAGCPVTTLQNWKSGSAPTDFVAVKKLAKALGVSMAYLLTGESDEEVSLKELLGDGGEVFSGLLDVSIRRVIPRKGK